MKYLKANQDQELPLFSSGEMDSDKMPQSAMTEGDDKQRRRREWEIEQKLNQKHEERKLWMIKKYEKERSHRLGYSHKNEDLEGQRNIKVKMDSENLENMIDKKELHLTKVEIQQNRGNRKKRSNDDTDDIIPRREGEGYRPLFDREEIKTASTQTTELQIMRRNHPERRLPTTEKSSSSSRRSFDDSIVSHCRRTHESSRYRKDPARDDKNKGNRNRSDERRVYVDEGRSKSSSDYIGRGASPSSRNGSSYRHRTRSNTPTSKYGKERHTNDNKNRSSSRRDYSNRFSNRFHEPSSRITLNNTQGNVGVSSAQNYGIGTHNSKDNTEYNSNNQVHTRLDNNALNSNNSALNSNNPLNSNNSALNSNNPLNSNNSALNSNNSALNSNNQIHHNGPEITHHNGPEITHHNGPEITHGSKVIHNGPKVIRNGPEITHYNGPKVIHNGVEIEHHNGPITHHSGPRINNVINHFHVTPTTDPWGPQPFPVIGTFLTPGPSSAPQFFLATGEFPPTGSYNVPMPLSIPQTFPSSESFTAMEPHPTLYFQPGAHER